MTQQFWPVLQNRITRLTDTLRQLKDRIRDAVASEMGRVVSDAVRDFIQTILQPRLSSIPENPPQPRSHEDDPEDPWEDEDEYRDTSPGVTPSDVVNTPPVPTWAAVVSVGMVVTKWLIRHRLPFWPTVGIGVGVGTVALVSKPILQTTLAAASTVVDLVRMTQFSP